MTNIDHQQNIAICEQYFPKFTWTVESDKVGVNKWVEYCGENANVLDIKINTFESCSKYQGEMRMNYDITFISTEPNLDLEAVLQQIKNEWLALVNEVL